MVPRISRELLLTVRRLQRSHGQCQLTLSELGNRHGGLLHAAVLVLPQLLQIELRDGKGPLEGGLVERSRTDVDFGRCSVVFFGFCGQEVELFGFFFLGVT